MGNEEEKSLVTKLDVSTLTVDQITKEYQSIQAMIEESEGQPSYELQEMHEYMTAIMLNKVDQICLLRNNIEANVDACKMQIKNDQQRLDLMDRSLERAMRAMGVKELSGLSHRVSFRKSSAVVITNEEAVPAHFKKFVVEIKDSFDLLDMDTYLLWASVILKKNVDKFSDITPEDKLIVDKYITKTVMKAEIKKELKSNQVDGIFLQENNNVQYQIGKAKVKALIEG